MQCKNKDILIIYHLYKNTNNEISIFLIKIKMKNKTWINKIENADVTQNTNIKHTYYTLNWIIIILLTKFSIAERVLISWHVAGTGASKLHQSQEQTYPW